MQPTGTATGALQPLTAAASGGITTGVTGTIASSIQPLSVTATGARLDVLYLIGQAVHAPIAAGSASHRPTATGQAVHAPLAVGAATHRPTVPGQAAHAPVAEGEAVHG